MSGRTRPQNLNQPNLSPSEVRHRFSEQKGKLHYSDLAPAPIVKQKSGLFHYYKALSGTVPSQCDMLTVTSQYEFENVMYVEENINDFTSNCDVHNIN